MVDAGEAEELELVAGVPVALAIVDDDTDGDEASVEVRASDATTAPTLPEAFWAAVEEMTGLEVTPDSDGVYLAVGGGAAPS